jgi:hypothetical protein
MPLSLTPLEERIGKKNVKRTVVSKEHLHDDDDNRDGLRFLFSMQFQIIRLILIHQLR